MLPETSDGADVNCAVENSVADATEPFVDVSETNKPSIVTVALIENDTESLIDRVAAAENERV